jgi:chromosome segregation ATPase
LERKAKNCKKIEEKLNDGSTTLDVINKEQLSSQIEKTVEKLETKTPERISEVTELRVEMQHGNEDMILKRVDEVKKEVEHKMQDIRDSVTKDIINKTKKLVAEKVGRVNERVDDFRTTVHSNTLDVLSKVSDLQGELRSKQRTMEYNIQELQQKDIKEINNKLLNHIDACELRQKVWNEPKKSVDTSEKDIQELRNKLLECSQSIKMSEMTNTRQDESILQLDKSYNELLLQLKSATDRTKLAIDGITNSNSTIKGQLTDLKTEVGNVSKSSGEHERRILVPFECSSQNIQ